MRRVNRKRYTKQTYDMVHIIYHAMKQVSMKRNMNSWEKQAEYEVSKKLYKFHMREELFPLDSPYIKEEENIAALEHLLLLKENWYLSIKSRQCADDQKQR